MACVSFSSQEGKGWEREGEREESEERERRERRGGGREEGMR